MAAATPSACSIIFGTMHRLADLFRERGSPGKAVATPPGTFEDHVKDMAVWGAAGQPCPE